MREMVDIIVAYVNDKREDEIDIQIEDIEVPAASISANERLKEDLSGNTDGSQWSCRCQIRADSLLIRCPKQKRV
jgi:hypothetical protein